VSLGPGREARASIWTESCTHERGGTPNAPHDDLNDAVVLLGVSYRPRGLPNRCCRGTTRRAVLKPRFSVSGLDASVASCEAVLTPAAKVIFSLFPFFAGILGYYSA
jgi:hypothetical protein